LLRTKYAWAQETVIACGILHNIGIEWADAVPDNEVALLAAAMPPPPPKPVVPLEDLEPAMVRARGQNLQDNLRLAMRRILVKIT
jgi:hypothetical protein